MRGPARSAMEMAYAVSLQPCPNCGRYDLSRYDVIGEANTWTLVGRCAGCDRGRTEQFETLGNPLEARIPLGELGAGPSRMLSAADLRGEVARVDAALKTDPRVLARAEWPAQLQLNQQALTALIELRKLAPGPEVETDFARHIAILRAFEAEENRVTPVRPPPSGELTATTVRAHASWLAKGRSGPGRMMLAHVDVAGQKLGNVQLIGARLDGVTFDRAGLAAASFDEADLTDVSFAGANLDDGSFSNAAIARGSFERARVAISMFAGAVVTGTDFTKADLERSTWDGARVAKAVFAEARFGNSTFKGATFTGCDLRKASFAKIQRLPEATTGARFEDCDLRDTDWTGRDLTDTQFVRCKLAGAHGAPSSRARLLVQDCDLPPEKFL